jgi:hypothetical protein
MSDWTRQIPPSIQTGEVQIDLIRRIQAKKARQRHICSTTLLSLRLPFDVFPMPLNPSQQKAIEEDGVQLIVDGPGSGKTRVVTEKRCPSASRSGFAFPTYPVGLKAVSGSTTLNSPSINTFFSSICFFGSLLNNSKT